MFAGSFRKASIGVDEMRAIVQIASRRPTTGRWQIVVVEDADRLTEGAANALLKVVEEPPPSTVFLLCAPQWIPGHRDHVAFAVPARSAGNPDGGGDRPGPDRR